MRSGWWCITRSAVSRSPHITVLSGVLLRLCLVRAHGRSPDEQEIHLCRHESEGVGGWFSLCRFSRKTEMGDEKRAEVEGSRSGAGGLIRSSVLLCLLWWTLGFNSVAPVCSGIRLLPWQSHTYSHSGGILLILGPANIQKYAHTCTVNGTHDFFYAWGTAELQILSTQCNTQADAHWHTSTVSQYTHLLFIMCKHGEP